MPNQFLSDEFGDIEDYFVTDYWLIDNFVGDQMFTWGNGENGRLGDNTATNKLIPVTTFAGGTTWKQVSCGGKLTSAIKTDGTLWTWGFNNHGQLGIDNTDSRSTPVTTFAGGTDWKQVAGGYIHTAAIKTDGSLWIWGNGGRLGGNTGASRSAPVTTFAGGTNWKSVSAGSGHTAAIKTDGSLWTWGVNSSGQLGVNNNTDRFTPVTTFAGGTDWKSVSGGGGQTAAIKTDGSLWIWGNNDNAQLGINIGGGNRSTPVTTFAGGNNWKQVACGNNYTAAIKTDGSLWTWGFGNNGVLGNFAATNRSTPVTTFAGGTNWKSVFCSFNGNHMVATKTDGTLWVWGTINDGRLGINVGSGSRSTPVTTFAGGNNWKSASCGYQHSAAIKSGLNVDLS